MNGYTYYDWENCPKWVYYYLSSQSWWEEFVRQYPQPDQNEQNARQYRPSIFFHICILSYSAGMIATAST